MAADISRAGVEKAYGRWAPVYDLVFGKVFDAGRQSTIAEADRIGGRVLDVGVGTGLSLSDYARTTRICGVDISEPMLRKALKRVREQKPGGELILVNHIGAEKGFRKLSELAFAPLARRLGWRPEFPWARLANWASRRGGVTLTERRPMPPMGHFSLIRYRKS